MRKLLLLLAIPVYLFACKDSGNTDNKKNTTDSTDTDEADTSMALYKRYPTYSTSQVEQMLKLYFDTMKAKCNYKNIVRGISFDNETLKQLTKRHNNISIYVGAYLTDTLGKKRGDNAVIIRLADRKGGMVFFDFHSLVVSSAAVKPGNGVCPPPDDVCPVSSSPRDE